MIGFEVKSLRKAFLIAFKKVRIVKKTCCNKRTFSGRKGGRQFRSGVDRTV
jgi:hypothetical protein